MCWRADEAGRAQEAKAIKGKSKYIELRNITSGVHFTTKTLKRLTDEYKDLTKEYDRKQSSLVKEVVAIAGQSRLSPPTARAKLTCARTPASYCPVLETLNDVIAHADVIARLAHRPLSFSDKINLTPLLHEQPRHRRAQCANSIRQADSRGPREG